MDSLDLQFAFTIVVLIASVIIHEVAHAYAAYKLGDQTPQLDGRLTLNPLRHLEWFGSVILPTVSYLLGGFIVGWAKPVRFNPYNLRNQRWGELLVAVAGPVSNIAIATVFGLLARFGATNGIDESFILIRLIVTRVNLVLAIFNLIPIPPLDGSKIVFAFLPPHLRKVRDFLERNALLLIVIVLFWGWDIIGPAVDGLYYLIIGGY